MGKRSRGHKRGDARLRILRDGDAPPTKRGTTQPGDALQPLVLELRKRLRNPDPWELLAFVSTIVTATEGAAAPEVSGNALHGLVESFIGVDLAETTAALHVLAVLVRDEDLVREIDAELGHRTQPMPLWLRDIRDTRVRRAAVVSAEDDIGEDIILGIEWAGAGEASFLTYIDHAAGTVVKDAFPAPMSVADALVHLEGVPDDDADVELEELDLGVARALLEDALDQGDDLDNDFESDTWPSSRPILEWLLSALPEIEVDLRGGPGVEDVDDFAEMVLRERADVIEEFSRSAEAARVGLGLTPDGQGRDDIAISLIVGADVLLPPEDFRRWTPERVHELLLTVLPANVLVDEPVAERIPQVLKAFGTWSLTGLDAPGADVTALADAIDRDGREYVALATSREAGNLREAIRAYERLTGLEDLALPILESDASTR